VAAPPEGLALLKRDLTMITATPGNDQHGAPAPVDGRSHSAESAQAGLRHDVSGIGRMRSSLGCAGGSGKEEIAGSFMARSQVPWGVGALGGTVSEPAWRKKRSWYLLTTEDRMIPPDAQRTMSDRAGSTVLEIAPSHSVYVSQPAPVAELIKQAATAIAADTVTEP
jgi:hypothetical protein